MAMIGAPVRGFPAGFGQTGIAPPTQPTSMFPVAPSGLQMPPPIPHADKPKINWVGVLADALAGAAGRPGMYAQQMAQQRQEQTAFERGEQQYQRRRADDREDWQWKQEHDVRPPDEFTRMMDAAGIPPDQRPGMYRQALERKINPPRTVVMADGTVMEIPNGPAPLVPSQPMRPVGPLVPINGGPTQPASGNFPR